MLAICIAIGFFFLQIIITALVCIVSAVVFGLQAIWNFLTK